MKQRKRKGRKGMEKEEKGQESGQKKREDGEGKGQSKSDPPKCSMEGGVLLVRGGAMVMVGNSTRYLSWSFMDFMTSPWIDASIPSSSSASEIRKPMVKSMI